MSSYSFLSTLNPRVSVLAVVYWGNCIGNPGIPELPIHKKIFWKFGMTPIFFSKTAAWLTLVVSQFVCPPGRKIVPHSYNKLVYYAGGGGLFMGRDWAGWMGTEGHSELNFEAATVM